MRVFVLMVTVVCMSIIGLAVYLAATTPIHQPVVIKPHTSATWTGKYAWVNTASQAHVLLSSAQPSGTSYTDSTNTISIISGGDTLARVAANGHVTCWRAKNIELQTSMRGVYFALCGHHKKVRRGLP